MTPFERALEFVIEEEGFYSNDPADPGLETKFGISRRSHPTLNIKDLTRAEASTIYQHEYWEACRCDILPDGMAFMMFDAAVQHSPDRAIKILQQAVNVKVDGIFGPITLKAVNRVAAAGLVADVISEMVAHRAFLYAQLPDIIRFGLGWYRRLAYGHQMALELVVNSSL